jgi:hypothetical protein
MSTRNLLGWVEGGRQPHRHLLANYLENVRALTSHNPVGLNSLLQG